LAIPYIGGLLNYALIVRILVLVTDFEVFCMSPETTFVQLKLRPEEVAMLDSYCRDQQRPPSRHGGAIQIFRRALKDYAWAKEASNVAAA
jgi:hypothetical protein